MSKKIEIELFGKSRVSGQPVYVKVSDPQTCAQMQIMAEKPVIIRFHSSKGCPIDCGFVSSRVHRLVFKCPLKTENDLKQEHNKEEDA